MGDEFRKVEACEQIRSGQRWSVGLIVLVFLALLSLTTAWGIRQNSKTEALKDVTVTHTEQIKTNTKALDRMVPTIERIDKTLVRIETKLEEQ